MLRHLIQNWKARIQQRAFKIATFFRLVWYVYGQTWQQEDGKILNQTGEKAHPNFLKGDFRLNPVIRGKHVFVQIYITGTYGKQRVFMRQYPASKNRQWTFGFWRKQKLNRLIFWWLRTAATTSKSWRDNRKVLELLNKVIGRRTYRLR